MNLQGDYEGLFLASILQLLCDENKTGFLRVTSGSKECRVFFNNGTIIYAMGSSEKGRLGQLLKKDGVITSEKLYESLVTAQEKKLALGKVLVDKGYISVEILKKYNKEQVEQVLYNLLLWKKGKFEYKDASINLDSMIVTALNPMKLILEASRRIDELSVLTEQIPSDTIVFQVAKKKKRNGEDIKLSENEQYIYSFIDGVSTIRNIIEKSGLDEFTVYKALFSILSYGLIESNQEIEFIYDT